MNQGLSGGAKAGYFFLGFFLALIGILIAWLVNKDKDNAIMKEAIKFSIIGCVVTVALGIIFGIISVVVLGSVVASVGFSY